MNWSAAVVALVPPTVVTVTSNVPAEPGGAVAVIWVGLLIVKLVAAVTPKLTALAARRLLPVMTTEVPPLVGPLAGLSAVPPGAAT